MKTTVPFRVALALLVGGKPLQDLVTATMVGTKDAVLDQAWRAIDALGGTDTSRPGDALGRARFSGYDNAVRLGLQAIEKLGGRDPSLRKRGGA